MDSPQLISDLGEKLQCFSCKNYLCYFPIHLCSNNQSICGRCTPPEGTTAIHDPAFEALCQLFKFPCQFKSHGCLQQFHPKDIVKHEEKCPYRVVPCVVKSVQCEWVGSLPALPEHCVTEHSNLILENGEVELDVSVSEDRENLLLDSKDFYVFLRKFDSGSLTLRCAFYSGHHNVGKPRPVELNIKNGRKKLYFEFETSTIDKIKFHEISVRSVVSSEINQEFLQVKVNLEKESEVLVNDDLNRELLSLLECSKCQDFTLAPIYRTGQDLKVKCSSCTYQTIKFSEICSTCSRLPSPDDTVLNHLAKLVHYPCMYRQHGCTHVSKDPEIRRHQKICRFATSKCIFEDCSWVGPRTNLNDHILQTHQELLTDPSKELEMSWKDTTMKCEVFNYGNRVFRLAYIVDEEKRYYKWSLQLVGFCPGRFKYEVGIVDGRNRGLKLSMVQQCVWTIDKEYFFSDRDDHYCFFDQEQLSRFGTISKEGLTVRFRVNVLS